MKVEIILTNYDEWWKWKPRSIGDQLKGEREHKAHQRAMERQEMIHNYYQQMMQQAKQDLSFQNQALKQQLHSFDWKTNKSLMKSISDLETDFFDVIKFKKK